MAPNIPKPRETPTVSLSEACSGVGYHRRLFLRRVQCYAPRDACAYRNPCIFADRTMMLLEALLTVSVQ